MLSFLISLSSYHYFIFSTERTTFLPRDLHPWKLSMQMPHPQRMTHWRPPTPTTATTGTTPNPTMIPTSTHVTMEILARPSLLLLMVYLEMHRPRMQDMVTPQCTQQVQPNWPATHIPQWKLRHLLPMAATLSHPPRLWWSLPTLRHPLPPWCAAMAL